MLFLKYSKDKNYTCLYNNKKTTFQYFLPTETMRPLKFQGHFTVAKTIQPSDFVFTCLNIYKIWSHTVMCYAIC